jgi:GINS complex subunit 1
VYQTTFPIELDLTKVPPFVTQDLEPPKNLFIEIRVLEDCGELVTADGTVIKLDRGATEYVKKNDVEHLIKQGFVVPTETQ